MFDVTKAFNCEGIALQINLDQAVAVACVSCSMLFHPTYKHVSEVFSDCVLSETDLFDNVLLLKRFEEANGTFGLDLVPVELEARQQKLPRPPDSSC